MDGRLAMTIIHLLEGFSEAGKWALCGHRAPRGTRAGQRIRADFDYELRSLNQEFPAGWRFCLRCERIHEAEPREDA